MSLYYKVIPDISERAHARILEVVNETDSFPPTYVALQNALNDFKSASRGIGMNVRTAILDPDDFIAYCRILHIPIIVENAMLYVATKPG